MGQQPVSFAPIRFKFFSSKVSGNDHRCPTCCCPPSSHLFIFSKRVFTKSVGWYKPSQLKCDKTSVFLKFWQEFKKKGKTFRERIYPSTFSLFVSSVYSWLACDCLLAPPPTSTIDYPSPWRLVFDSKTTVLTPALSLLTLSRLSMNVSIFYFFFN